MTAENLIDMKISKKTYKAENTQYLAAIARQPDVRELAKGILCKVIESGNGRTPSLTDVASVYYKGSLINGKVFDDNTAQAYPDSFRLRELIEGWQIALTRMKEGDKWMIFVPSELGYGSRGDCDIPGNSTLIFEIKLVKVN